MQPETTTQLTGASEPEKHKFLVVALNGTALYVLAYYLVWGLHTGAKMGISRYLGLRGIWDPSRVVYTLADGEWWRTAIVAVYGIGPLVCLLVGVVAFRWYWRRERARRGQLKLLLLWVAFHCCNAVFGALLVDTFTHSGFWYVPEWLLKLGSVVNVLLAVVAGLVQLGLGYLGAVAFLQAHDSKTVLRLYNRRRMVVVTLLAPWLAGGLFIALTKMPYFSAHEALHLVAMGLLVGPTALGCLGEMFSDTVRRPRPTQVAWGLVGLAVLAALAWRLALSPPVVFG